ncbi:MAG: DUF4355 domain-containing protein [Oscillospiraceae bacterium]|nr:DUF4355 domain-containing protein [Oscillospiraceae bacterium]
MDLTTPITTQEQLDTLIGERIKRERDTVAKKYGDYDDLKTKAADYEKQIGDLSKTIEDSGKKYAGYDQTIADLTAKVKGYETSSVKMRIAHETGIPYELATRLSGETEDDIRKDAEALSKLVGKPNQAPPLKSTEPAGGDTKTAALRTLAQTLTNKGD